ncbi:MAG: solute carrier family 26 protein [Bacteroidota bacterium]
MKKILPIFDWLPKYQRSWLKGDLSAGLTTGVMLIPQAMAYAMIAGLPPIYGLYTAIFPLFIYAIFGTSRQLAVGPVAMIALLIAAGVGSLAEAGSEAHIGTSILLAAIVGVIQLVMGIFRLGFLVNFLSFPVITGFTSAAALIIGFSQLKHLLGIDITGSEYFYETLYHILQNISNLHFITFAIGTLGIIVMLVSKKYKFSIPAPLLVVIFGTGLVATFDLHEAGVRIIGAVPSGLPLFQFPNFDLSIVKQLLPIAFTIAFIGFMQSIAVAKAMQAKHKNYELNSNQELVALGFANFGGAFFQAFPVAGGFARTAVNDQAGAKTGLAAIISASLIVMTLLFLTPLFYYLPRAVLASIIMVAVLGLVNLKEAKFLWTTDRNDFWMMLVTFTATLILGIEEGIALGVLLSLGIVIYKTSKPDLIELGKIPEHPLYKNIDRFDSVVVRDDLLIIRFDARLYYANARHFKYTLLNMMNAKGDPLSAIILNADSINSVDSSAIHAIQDIVAHCRASKIAFYMVAVKGVVRDKFKKAGVVDRIGKDHFLLRIQHAVNHFDKKEYKALEYYALQHNEKKKS